MVRVPKKKTISRKKKIVSRKKEKSSAIRKTNKKKILKRTKNRRKRRDRRLKRSSRTLLIAPSIHNPEQLTLNRFNSISAIPLDVSLTPDEAAIWGQILQTLPGGYMIPDQSITQHLSPNYSPAPATA